MLHFLILFLRRRHRLRLATDHVQIVGVEPSHAAPLLYGIRLVLFPFLLLLQLPLLLLFQLPTVRSRHKLLLRTIYLLLRLPLLLQPLLKQYLLLLLPMLRRLQQPGDVFALPVHLLLLPRLHLFPPRRLDSIHVRIIVKHTAVLAQRLLLRLFHLLILVNRRHLPR